MLFCLEVYLLLLEVLADDYLDLIWTFLVHSLLVGVIFKVSFESIPSSSNWLIVWTSMWLFAFTVAFFGRCCPVALSDAPTMSISSLDRFLLAEAKVCKGPK